MMNEKLYQHIGDDQLVYGMPKHMVGSVSLSSGKTEDETAGNNSRTYWTVHPKSKACDKCQAMAGIKFSEKPERPHPNCKCEMREHEGLADGQIDCSHLIEIALPGVGTTLLDNDFAQRVQKWRALNVKSGINLTFASGFRLTKRQGGLKDDPTAKTPAKAGTSLHEAGRTVDVNNTKEYMDNGLIEIIVQNARSVGVSWGDWFGDYRHFYREVPGGRANSIKYIQRAQTCARQVL